MIIAPDPTCRTLPVDLPPTIMRRVISGRVRVLALPGARAAHVGEGDCLWVREQFRVFPAGPGLLDVEYGAERVRGVRWPRALAQPSAGLHLAEAMPVQLSRATLVVHAARTIRLHQMTVDEACAAGVVINGPRYGHAWVPDGEWDEPAEAFGLMWDLWHGAHTREGWAVNPEVRLVQFRAVMRNIGDFVPGIGRGAVMRRRIDDSIVDDMVRLARQGLWVREIGRRLGYGSPTVARKLRARGVVPVEGPRGSRGRSTWTVEEAEQLLASGLSVRAIARRFGVSDPAIHQRLKRARESAQPSGPPKLAYAGAGDHHRAAAPDAPPPPSPAPSPRAPDPALIDTGGRYAELAAYAAARGLPLTRVQAMWHATGLRVQPRCTEGGSEGPA